VQIAPWEEVAINLIGPWKVKVNGQQVEFSALTCIDMASNLAKLIRVDNKTAKHIPDKFTKSWLCQYPCPVQCHMTREVNSSDRNFYSYWKSLAFKDVCSTSKNPQSNAICERIHQTVNNVLRKLVHTNPPQNITQASDTSQDQQKVLAI
jgi:hypothetical protein